MFTSVVQIPIDKRISLSRYEAAAYLGISVLSLDRLVATGEIRFRRVGGPIRGRVLISRSELVRFAEGVTSKE